MMFMSGWACSRILSHAASTLAPNETPIANFEIAVQCSRPKSGCDHSQREVPIVSESNKTQIRSAPTQEQRDHLKELECKSLSAAAGKLQKVKRYFEMIRSQKSSRIPLLQIPINTALQATGTALPFAKDTAFNLITTSGLRRGSLLMIRSARGIYVVQGQ